jgi:PAS domain-containing protein
VNGVFAGAQRPPADLLLVLCANPGRSCAQSEVMLARLRRGGTFELLTSSAWARALGYPPQELSGKSLRELMSPEQPAGEIIATLLDTDVSEPLQVSLRCKDAQRKCFRFHRRFDPHEETVFLVAEEVSAAGG